MNYNNVEVEILIAVGSTVMEHFKPMANPDQKTILIDNAFEEIKNICINLQRYWCFNSELKSLLKLIINE